LHGAQAIFSEDLSAAFCRAINDWVAKEWLDRDTRLRASIVVPMHSPELAAREIERCAADSRFVQVLVWEMQEIPLGRRQHWPIYRVAEQLDLPIGIHAGSSYRHPPTNLGWPSYYLEDYVSWSTGFAGVLNSLISEGVFVEFPRLKVVLMESGVTWLPAWMWRANKTWRGVRAEVPWLEKSPAEYAREHVRLTSQPFDAPPNIAMLRKIIEEIDCEDMLLFATDYPHWHFDGNDALPDGLPEHLIQKILVGNALKTYPRLTS
jgi:predicted TIM-barrel fold metal-dependent hydrolase